MSDEKAITATVAMPQWMESVDPQIIESEIRRGVKREFEDMSAGEMGILLGHDIKLNARPVGFLDGSNFV